LEGRTVAPTDLEPAGELMFGHFRALGSRIADRCRPGLKPDDVETKIRALGRQPPYDLIRLDDCCDGTTKMPSGRVTFQNSIGINQQLSMP
jgi:hypothetical protein